MFFLLLQNVLYALKKQQQKKTTLNNIKLILFYFLPLSYPSASVKREEENITEVDNGGKEKKRRNLSAEDFIICGHQYSG